MLSKDDLIRAWDRVRRSGGDFVPMGFDASIYDHFKDENLNRLHERVVAGYQFGPARIIDVPKLKGTLRPGTHLGFDDHVVYAAVVEALYDSVCKQTIRHQLDDVVFSHKVKN